MYCSAFQAIGQSGTTTIKKASVRPRQCQGECDLVRCFLPRSAFDQGNHPIKKGLARRRRDIHDDPIRYDKRTAGDTGAISAGLANHRSRLACDRRLVDRRDSFDYLTVARNDLARRYYDSVAGLELGRADLLHNAHAFEPVCWSLAARLAQRLGLRLAACLGKRSCNVGEEHREEQPCV